jgi:tetratricopeptide (TPR) repeat protein
MPRHRTINADLSGHLKNAHAAHVEGALARAEKLYREILRRHPDSFDVLHRLGILSHQQGRPAEAARYLIAALKLNPKSAEALSDYGFVQYMLGRIDVALVSYRTALTIEPENDNLLVRNGVALLNLGQPNEALKSFDRVLARYPAHVEALGNRGNALLKLNRLDEAIVCYDAARQIEGDNGPLLTNRAHALRRIDRLEEALVDLRAAIALDPNNAEAHFEFGMTQLTLGNLDNGWEAYERRWATSAFASHRRNFKSPLWTGDQSVNGRTILLHSEQGFGDTIQFVRYAAFVRRMGATVLLEVQPELVDLMVETGCAAQVVARGQKLIAFDFHCPLMSLPRAFRTNLTSIPATVPYIKVSEAISANWAKRLPASKTLIGFAWAGRHTHHNDVNRSIGLNRLAPIFDIADVKFVSLQHDPKPEERAFLHNLRNVLDVGDELQNFADTAALISQLDLVISVDTAVVHLTGALAKPMIVLLPFASDFRWLRTRDDSPWYPTARLFRQPRLGDWESVIEQVRGYLARVLSHPASPRMGYSRRFL